MWAAIVVSFNQHERLLTLIYTRNIQRARNEIKTSSSNEKSIPVLSRLISGVQVDNNSLSSFRRGGNTLTTVIKLPAVRFDLDIN